MILSLWNKFISIGTKAASRERYNRQIILTNQITFIQIIITCTFILIFYTNYLTKLIIPMMIITTVFIITLYLNYLHTHTLARFLMIANSNIGILYFASVLGKECGVQMVYYAIAWLPLMIFDMNNKWKIIISILITIGCFITLEVSKYSIFLTLPLHKNTQHLFYILLTLTTFSINMLGILIFFSTTFKK